MRISNFVPAAVLLHPTLVHSPRVVGIPYELSRYKACTKPFVAIVCNALGGPAARVSQGDYGGCFPFIEKQYVSTSTNSRNAPG